MNQYQIDFIEDPPPKCPYFTLPDPCFFITQEELLRDQKSRPGHTSLINLFGSIDKMSDDLQTQFLLNLIQYSTFTPDYDAMALALNLTNGNIVRRRFVAIAERQGFQMEGETVKAGDGNTPTKNKSASKTATSAPRRKSKVANTTTQGEPKREEEASSLPSAKSILVSGNSEASTGMGHMNAAGGADVEDNVD